MLKVKDKNITIKCFHCGEICRQSEIIFEEKNFCCEGCKAVYEILKGSDLCSYYNLNEKTGQKLSDIKFENKFEFLNDKDIQEKIHDFRDNKVSKITLTVPGIHCSSCIWLLEKLYKLNPAIKSSLITIKFL